MASSTEEDKKKMFPGGTAERKPRAGGLKHIPPSRTKPHLDLEYECLVSDCSLKS